MDEMQLRQIAGQLRQPHGDAGIEVGQRMNVGNEIINRRAIAQLTVQPDDRVLELGPGNGYFAREIVTVHPSVRYVGCDFSNVMIEQARQLNIDLVQSGQAQFILRADATLPFADASFEKVLTINTLYFWDDPAAELAEIRRVLVPGGRIVIGIRPRRVMEQMAFVQYGFTTYAPEEAADLLTKNGFKLTSLTDEPEPDQIFFGKSIAMASVLLCGQVPG
ncbi:methyltransferase domain-containing protein [Fibrisoma montanum]|uniref:Methyltransferase domain-containing protein n=1 Tax=Fibrisoma montanum TaxID=2305895 RepID=A0A418MDS6_9BACT|nr:class I SAM-dependent methyltransferase [Fibrisoma montanum]RIV24970.1 methyltransferase domain-containing protein [Fibrisoma montanum]